MFLKVKNPFNINPKDIAPLREYIKTINPLEVTPMQAINILDEIKKKSEE